MMFNHTQKQILYECFKSRNEGISRVDMARQISITDAAMSQYVNKFIDQGILNQIGLQDTKSIGRNKVLLDINPHFGYVVGVAFEFDLVEIAITNSKGEHKAYFTKNIPFTKMQSFLKKNLKKIFLSLLENAKIPIKKIMGVGITRPHTAYYSTYHFPKSEDEFVMLRELQIFTRAFFEDEYGLIVETGNNVQCLAFAEYMLSHFNDNFICIKYGPRIGSALWLQGNVLKGSHESAGEIGHMVLPTQTFYKKVCPVCGKKGCLETLVSEESLHDMIARIPNYRHEFSFLFTRNRPLSEIKLEEVFTHVHKHPKLYKMMKHIATSIAVGVSTIEKIVDCKKIVLFGKSFLVDDFFTLVKNSIITLSQPVSEIDIVRSHINPDHKVTGASFLILTNLLFV